MVSLVSSMFEVSHDHKCDLMGQNQSQVTIFPYGVKTRSEYHV